MTMLSLIFTQTMFPEPLVQVLIWLLVAGLFLWVVSQLPLDAQIVRFIRVVVIVAICCWMIYLLAGILPGAPVLRR